MGRNAIGGGQDNDPNADLLAPARPKDPYGNGELSGAGSEGMNPRGLSTFGGRAATQNPDGSFTPSSAQTAAEGYNRQAVNAANTQGRGLNYGAANQDFGNATENRNLAGGARTQQQDAAGLMRDAAYGNQPSQAEILGHQQTQNALNAQLAGAASAKGGPLAQMSAQRNAAQNAAAYTANADQGIAAMRAGEMAGARNAYAGQTNAIHSGDLQGRQIDLGAAGQHAQMEQAAGALDMQQRDINAKREMGYNQLGYNTQNDEANRGVQSAQIQAENWRKQTDTNEASKRDSQGLVAGIAGGAAKLLGGMLAKGGPADQGQVYLVGEKGPELIIPRHDGQVIPADKTADLLARAAGGPISGADSMTTDISSSGSPLDALTGKEGGSPMSPVGGGGTTGGMGTMGSGRKTGAGPFSFGGGRAGGGPVAGYSGTDKKMSSMLDDRFNQTLPETNTVVDQGGPTVDDMLNDRMEQTAGDAHPAPPDLLAAIKRESDNADFDQRIKQAPATGSSLGTRQNPYGPEPKPRLSTREDPYGPPAGAPKNQDYAFGQRANEDGTGDRYASLVSGLGTLGGGVGRQIKKREEGGPVEGASKSKTFTTEGALQEAAAKMPQPKSFQRDTQEDQRRIGKSYRDKQAERAMLDAEAMMRGMDASLASGPSVKAREEGGPVKGSPYRQAQLRRERNGARDAVSVPEKYGVSADESPERDYVAEAGSMTPSDVVTGVLGPAPAFASWLTRRFIKREDGGPVSGRRGYRYG